MEEATRAYEGALTAEAAQYLHARGIGREEAVSARLGVVADPLPGHGKYRNMLAIPYLDRNGKPLTIRFRCLQEHNHRDFFHGKYNTIKDDTPRMYGIDSIHQAGDTLDLTEGELDRAILRKIGLFAVAAPGANSWQPRHRRMLAGFSRIRVWGDPDEAGAEFSSMVCRQLRSAEAMRLRVGDVTETYMAGGAEALLSLIDKEVC
ncbi:toprim domain-containing protein [Streptomyces sp. NPDC057499]|uniref:toprim domain-containing protein n=1 Tax=Streptomyces sp. NPDC057499 TaxID=3346150 RepID=UPI00368AA363